MSYSVAGLFMTDKERRSDLSCEYLRSVLNYDSRSGQFTWRVRASSRAAAGARAGSPHKEGYWLVRIKGVSYLAHRLAWFYVTGRWPRVEIDHEDRVRNNNAWFNLREATRTQQRANERIRCNNTSGARGVFRKRKKWSARMTFNGKPRTIGSFKTVAEAKRAVDLLGCERWGAYYGTENATCPSA